MITIKHHINHQHKLSIIAVHKVYILVDLFKLMYGVLGMLFLHYLQVSQFLIWKFNGLHSSFNKFSLIHKHSICISNKSSK